MKPYCKMASFPCIHHVEVGVTDGPRAVNILRKNYTFEVLATRNSKVARQWLLVRYNTRFLVTCLKNNKRELIKDDDYVIDWMGSPNLDTKHDSKDKQPRKDSVFNICLQVNSIEKILERFRSCGIYPFKNIKTLTDSFGSVRVATVKSSVGDVYHTLVEKGNYKGRFLPAFSPQTCVCDPVSDSFWTTETESISNQICSLCNGKNTGDENGSSSKSYPVLNEDNLFQDEGGECPTWTTFDHIALAVEMGTAQKVIDWYEKCFGMRRFMINCEEDDREGLVLSHDNVGLRLRAMEYWKCSETGLGVPKSQFKGNSFSVVIAEGLPPVPGAKEENQIESWLKQHGGPGVQHLAFNTSNIKATVGSLKQFGAAFANPPPDAYYSEVGRLYDIERTGEDLETLRQHGILIDTEADSMNDKEAALIKTNEIKERYLLQIFTRPVFPRDPFFMEIIQREGATGFGSGNVAALYRSVQSCILDKAKELKEQIDC